MKIEQAVRILKNCNNPDHPSAMTIDPKLINEAIEVATQFIDDVLAEDGMAEK